MQEHWISELLMGATNMQGPGGSSAASELLQGGGLLKIVISGFL